MDEFVIKPYPFRELAQLYYPDHAYQSALRLFRREMHDTRGMWPAMIARATRRTRRFSPEPK